jgi:hypothetical protein
LAQPLDYEPKREPQKFRIVWRNLLLVIVVAIIGASIIYLLTGWLATIIAALA